MQDPPFRPLTIERGALKPAEVEFEPPATCEGAPPPEPVDEALKKAKASFAALHGGQCVNPTPGADPQALEADAWSFTFRTQYDPADAPERKASLYRFFCDTGAYNEQHIYYLQIEDDGLRELQFATPDLDIRYENDDSDGKVEEMRVIGFNAADRLVNSSYDATTHAITSHSLWRGVGDASSTGRWIFRNGEFVLVHYEVDATYDGEINPETVIDYESAP